MTSFDTVSERNVPLKHKPKRRPARKLAKGLGLKRLRYGPS